MRTARVAILIRNNGTPLGSVGFTTIDLAGSVSATDAGGGVATVTGAAAGVGANVATEVLTATQSGTDVTLNLASLLHAFTAVEVVFRNGQALTPIAYWSLSASTITIFNADAGDSYMVQYTW